IGICWGPMVGIYFSQHIEGLPIIISLSLRTQIINIIALASLQKNGEIKTLIRHRRGKTVSKVWVGIADNLFISLISASISVEVFIDYITVRIIAFLDIAIKGP